MYSKFLCGVAIATALLFSACGDDGSSTEARRDYDWSTLGDVVRGVCNLKPCDMASDGDSIYVLSEKQNYYCRRGAWEDSAGGSISDAQFISCYMENIIQDTLESRDKLPACTETAEGQIFVAGSDMVGCTAGEWVRVSDKVVSEFDMAGCTVGDYVFVLSKQAVSRCEPTAGSSSGTMNSSSSMAEPADDGTKVRGVCVASVRQVERGDSVTYSFYNMGGAPQTFSWDFGDVADVESSKESAPTVTFLSNGNFRVGLVVNKGMESESDSILCPVVRATGRLITGCECDVDKSRVRVSKDEPDSAVWTVSGCKGGEDIRYHWRDASTSAYILVQDRLLEEELDSAWKVSEDGMSIKMVLDSTRKVAPQLRVSNETDEYMDVECPAVRAVKKERVYAQCSMEFAGDTGYTFTMHSISGADYLMELPMVLSSDHGYSADVKAKCFMAQVSYGDDDDAVCVSWGYSMVRNSPVYFAVPKPDVPGIHTYTLTFDGEEVCSARMPLACAPDKERAFMNDSVKWIVKGLNGFEVTSYEWTSYKNATIDFTSTDESPAMKYTEPGTYGMTLFLDRDLETQTTIRCKDLIVRPHSISNCSCDSPELVSESDDVTQVDAVTFRWNIAGCKSDLPLSYAWPEEFTVDEADPSQATATFTTSGFYVPDVSVSNADGATVSMKCKVANVKGADSQSLTYGGQTYQVVEIEGRTWMAENLNYPTPFSMCFDNLEENCEKYGRLYSYEEAVEACPEGWHLPGVDEFLEIYSMISDLPAYGFEPLPAGMYEFYSELFIADEMSWWFDYLVDGVEYGMVMVIGDDVYPYRDEYVENAHSVRCVKD